MARPKSKIYYAVAYLRLSREDGDKGESNSITNQKKLIQEYVSKSKDIKLVGEFQDDGFTGTNFNRPGFRTLWRCWRRERLIVSLSKIYPV